LGLTNVRPLDAIESAPDATIGSGRYGNLAEPNSLEELARLAMKVVGASRCRVVESNAAEPSRISKVAIACGSGGSLLAAAVRRGCDAMITGEATFHTCLEARASGISLVLTGHFWSERFAMEWLAERMARELKGLNVFSSEQDADPLKDLV
jgi:putative NIF3 family GTP cyclohydrolase 1 type 2